MKKAIKENRIIALFKRVMLDEDIPDIENDNETKMTVDPRVSKSDIDIFREDKEIRKKMEELQEEKRKQEGMPERQKAKIEKANINSRKSSENIPNHEINNQVLQSKTKIRDANRIKHEDYDEREL